jgi:MFS family permease
MHCAPLSLRSHARWASHKTRSSRDRVNTQRLRWTALVNTSLSVIMGGLNTSIVLIALPAIFRGLNVDPLAPENSSLLLWMIMGFPVVTTTMLVMIGRTSDMFGRVRIYIFGFTIFTAASTLLSVVWTTGTAGALIIGLRFVQAIGSAFQFASSAAILTDFFPPTQRGFALGTNQLAMIFGTMAGLILGGLLAVADYRAYKSRLYATEKLG